MSWYACDYPGCDNGHFCPKHVATPFRTRAEKRARTVVTAEARGISGKEFLAEVENMRAEGIEFDFTAWLEEWRKADSE